MLRQLAMDAYSCEQCGLTGVENWTPFMMDAGCQPQTERWGWVCKGCEALYAPEYSYTIEDYTPAFQGFIAAVASSGSRQAFPSAGAGMA